MEHEVFEMDKLAVDPQRGAGVGEMHPLDPPYADRITGDRLGEMSALDPALPVRHLARGNTDLIRFPV